ncbi:MAG: ABC transporter permease [Nitrososphaerota archaeon]|nr:ABC transporter permease [Nitrososphaerota archaeon]MDG7023265.1 ABC transporter permease [Nitrososphaerota archaeon]
MDLTFLVIIGAIGLQQTVTVALAAQGELVTEKSGILNIGLEGVMLMAAFSAAYANWFFEGRVGLLSPYLALAVGAAVGMVANLIFAFISTKVHVDQVIAGIGINIFAGGITIVGTIVNFQSFDSTPLANQLPSIFSIPGMGTTGSVSFLEIGMFVVPVLVYLLLKRTAFGLHVRAVGENPKAAEAAGLNVSRTRILATTVGGALLGLAGANLSVALSNYFVRSMTRGLGFIALAAVIAGAWSPVYVLGMSILFGMSWGVYIQYNSAMGLTFLFGSLPYLVTVIVLAIASTRLRPPAALALPYKKE